MLSSRRAAGELRYALPFDEQAGEQDPDLFFTDRPRDSKLGNRNKEYVSIFADEVPRVLSGRSPLECYADFMHAFRYSSPRSPVLCVVTQVQEGTSCT